MFNIILFGPPGSGKGTQSEKLIASYGLKHLSTGDLLRNEIAHKTTLGLAAKNYMDKGQLVPDEVVIGMIDTAVQNHTQVKGFLFDGFPRTQEQSEALDALLKKKGMAINVVLALQVSEEELVKRLLNRGKTSGRMDDTNESIIRARITEYHAKTSVVEKHYRAFDKVVAVPGEGSMENIFNDLCQAINTKQALNV
jgi:adenylate kinase